MIARLNLARELLEHEVLVLHLGAELGGLEQALAVPLERGRSATGRLATQIGVRSAFVDASGRRGQRWLLGLLDQPVVLGVEDLVHGGQADVLVAPGRRRR